MSERNPASLNATLEGIELVRNSLAGLLPVEQASPLAAIMNHGIRTMLDLAAAVKAATEIGDLKPLNRLYDRLRLNEMEIT